MTKDVNDAPDPDSDEFLENQNTVEKVSPGTTADAPATDPELIPTDPGTTGGTGSGTAGGSAAGETTAGEEIPAGDLTDHGVDPAERH